MGTKETLQDIRRWARDNVDDIFLVVTVNNSPIALDKQQIDACESDEDLINMLKERSKPL